MAGFFGDLLSMFGLGGGQQGGSSNRSTYIPTGLGTADTTFQGLLGQGSAASSSAANQIDPAISAAFAKALGIDPSQFLAFMQQAGNLSAGQIAPALNAQGNLITNAKNAQGVGNQLYQTAFDPENALRDRYQQTLTDASRAGTSARGIGMGGESAGIENQSVSNFLQDWQDRQVGREATGTQGLVSAYDQAGRDYAGGLAAGGLAPGYAQAAGSIPYGAQQTAATAPFNYANLFNAAQGGANQNLSGWLQQIIPYLNQGLGATGQGFAQGQTGINALTKGLGTFGPGAWDALSKAFGSGAGGAGAASTMYDPSVWAGGGAAGGGAGDLSFLFGG